LTVSVRAWIARACGGAFAAAGGPPPGAGGGAAAPPAPPLPLPRRPPLASATRLYLARKSFFSVSERSAK